jgi:hypothetical protein
MAAETVVTTNLNTAIGQATNLQSQAASYTQQAIAASMSYATMPNITDLDDPNVQIQQFNPDTDLSAEFKAEYGNVLGDLEGKMSSLLPDLINTWFPNFNVCLPKAEEWICNTIENGGTGMPANVEEAIWQRARDREAIEGKRMEDEALNSFLSRGFDLPSGVLAERLLSVQSAVSDRVAVVNREVMIKQAEIEIENIKFAVEKAVQLRLQIWDSVLRYIGDYMRLSALAGDNAKAVVSAKQGLWDATSRYYSSLVEVERLKQNARIFNKEMDFKLASKDVDSFNLRATRNSDMAFASARLASQLAAAWAGAQNSLSMVSNNTNIKG